MVYYTYCASAGYIVLSYSKSVNLLTEWQLKYKLNLIIPFISRESYLYNTYYMPYI